MPEFKITAEIARAEQDRRTNNRRAGVEYEPAAHPSLLKLGTKALARKAGTRKVQPAQVAKVSTRARHAAHAALDAAFDAGMVTWVGDILTPAK